MQGVRGSNPCTSTNEVPDSLLKTFGEIAELILRIFNALYAVASSVRNSADPGYPRARGGQPPKDPKPIGQWVDLVGKSELISSSEPWRREGETSDSVTVFESSERKLCWRK
jgi:hypothetical protein